MLWQGGVHTYQYIREKMVGVNLYRGSMEVAFEQWTEQEKSLVDFNVIFQRYKENSINVWFYVRMKKQMIEKKDLHS